VKVYNAGTGSADLRYVDQEWIKYDLLVYSPSISSGVSFVAEHFDCVVGYLVNSRFTPGVETGLQQLFRVRQLKDGGMYLFVHNARPGVVLPCETEEIDALLTDDLMLASKHFVTNQLTFEAQVRFDTDHFEYDKTRMSWHIICGIIQTQNQSAMYFTDILAGALSTDYAIRVERVGVQSAIGTRDLDLAILQNAAKTRAIPAFETILRLTDGQYDTLKASTVELALEERAALRLYDCEHGIWGVTHELVDDEFYRTLVMAAGAFDYYFHVKRFMSLTQSLDENTARMRSRMREIMEVSDKNLDLFKCKSRTHYTLLFTGQTLLQRVLSGTQIAKLTNYGQVLVAVERVETEVTQYLADLKLDVYEAFMAHFKITPETVPLKILQTVIRAVFGISVARQHGSSEKKAYNVIRFNNDKLQRLVEKYRPTFPAMG
jgi:septum formation topological specificity factor MinE